ncbi:MAG TPA: glutamate 5-kinase [Thiothrix sp.]|nr:glutamate 5-kinase [Thiothrix sp.]
MMNKRNHNRTIKRCIVKIGSALITQNGTGLDQHAIYSWTKQIADIKAQGTEIILVSSGSIAEGMCRMGWQQRPTNLCELQAAAAIGQAGLIQTYQQSFAEFQLQTAQVLLTHDDLRDRRRYLNARSTLKTLLELNAVPIVNENDTISFKEIRLGDNDTLSALVANLVDADLLIILTDQQGLYNKDPRHHADAQFISEDSATNPALLDYAGGAGTTVGTGGMRTKVLAAQKAALSGCSTLIASGREPNVLTRLFAEENLGTLLTADCEPLAARKQWIANQLNTKGQLTLDNGAITALKDAGRSLLPIGTTSVNGIFERGDIIDCLNTQDHLIARGLVNYSSEECEQILGVASRDIEKKLGYIDTPELIHRDNLVIL